MSNNLNQQNHDHFFRSVMSNIKVAKDFFSRHLPENIKKDLDLDDISFCKETYIDEELKESLWSGTMEFIFKHIFARDILPYLEQIKDQLQILEKENINGDLLIILLKYIIPSPSNIITSSLLSGSRVLTYQM
jgi:hypothetical protein